MKCPHCEKPDFDAHCRFCGCMAKVNPVSGNTIYMIRGRVVKAPDDMKAQQALHDERHEIKADPDPIDAKGLPVATSDED